MKRNSRRFTNKEWQLFKVYLSQIQL